MTNPFRLREELEHAQLENQTLKDELNRLRAEKKELEADYLSLFSTLQKYERLVQSTTMLIEMAVDPDQDFNKIILDTAFELIPEADYGSISIIKDEDWLFVYAAGHNLEALKSIPFKKSYFLDPRDVDSTLFFDSNVFVVPEAWSIQNMPEEVYRRYREAVLPVRESAVVQIDLANQIAGHLSLDIGTHEEKHFSKESLKVMEALGSITSAFFAFQRLSKLQEEFQREIILSIIRIVEIHDTYTKGHSEHVASISLDLAKEMGLSAEVCRQVYWSGLVHDIGKILVSQSVLNKPDRLSDSEFEMIKNHPVWGYEVLTHSKELREIAIFVRHHHERYDGNGYPDRLAGEGIPMISRILTVADSWDAMIRDRAYRKGLSREVAIDEIKRNVGLQFDPNVAKAFMRLCAKGAL
ncbi:MAG TPA: HD-GYP domain-containing protein [Thermotogota bacterium]|jgi:putative nucleotidyltransferase with HDIG domain|nr:MAG: Cyclic di-GMP phosphodiesterase response regulator RpfG [Thermotogota bacterium ADurb.Bin062]HNW46534.1 HD-GYP domain-containing protein [Thermotogota bacterium]HNY81612.1 HD-GYP domain-containing protein [Thermotogota bacterium]HOD91471.1 HD-GYP domain-containing protein [Thermotogota bacterium]HOF22745.1 HD-GYP domain-containing protein [Thermotogota bacterium]